MSITQTKFRKGYVETPILKTDDIEYMGHELPLYDVITESIIQTPKDKSVEIGASTTYQEVQNNHIRFLTRSPFFDDNSLFTLRQIDLHFGGTNTTNEFISLCIFGLRNGAYVFLGESTNAYLRPRTEITLPFYFNTELFERMEEGIMPYDQIFIRTRLCQIDENGMMIGGKESYEWDDISFTAMKVKGCNKNNSSYNPYIITDGDNGITPHVKLLYSAANLGVGDKIPHNLNAEVHLTPRDKENVERLSELGSAVLMEEQKHVEIMETRSQTTNYARTGEDTIVSVLMNPTKYVGLILEEIEIRRGSINQGNRITGKWLQADCFDTSGNLIDTHFSTHSNSQTTDDGGKTKWKFSNFEIKDTYGSIEFRMSNSGTIRQERYITFAGSNLQNSSGSRILYESGWVTKWAVNQNLDNISVQQFTADFVLTFKPKIITGLKFIQHITDEEVHITSEEKDLLHDLTSEILSDSETRLLDTRQLVPQTVNAIQAEQIYSWEMGVTENERNYNFEEIVLRRKDSSFSGVHAAENDCWLFVDCYNESNQIIHTAYSTNTQRQNSNDGLKSTWQFQDFIIPNDCVKMRFSLTKTEGVREPNTNKIRSSSLKHDNTKLLVDANWKTINQNGVIEQFTSDFSVTLSKKLSVISSHIKNQTIHVTEEEKEKIQSIDGLNTHVNTNSLHWQESDRTDITNLKNTVSTHNSHVSNNDIHVTNEQKNIWNNGITSYESHNSNNDRHITTSERLFIDSIQHWPVDFFYSTLTDGFIAPSGGKTGANSIQLTQAHFTSGIIKQIEIPYYGGSGAMGYLCVQIFKDTDDENTIKTIDQCFYSTNSQTQNSDGTSTFTFDNLRIPESYSFIRLMLVSDKSLVPNGKTGENCIQFRCRILATGTEQSPNYNENPNDLCKVWTGSNSEQNWYAYVNVSGSTLGGTTSIIDEVNSLKELVATLQAEIDELKGNSTI